MATEGKPSSSGSFAWKVAEGMKEVVPAAASVRDPVRDTGFTDRTVVVCCVPISYQMEPSKSLQIQANVKDKLRSYRFVGDVESVVYPVNTKDIGLRGIELPNAAVVTFSTKICAEKYACLKRMHSMLYETNQKFIVKEHTTISAHLVNRFPPGSFKLLVSTMAKYHGIHIKETLGKFVCTGYPFQTKFLMKVILSDATPVNDKKLRTYPFQVEATSESPHSRHPDIPVTHKPPSEKTVQISPALDCYFNKTKVLERLEVKYNVQILIERKYTWAHVCRIQGQVNDTQKAVDEIKELKTDTEKRLVAVNKASEPQLKAFVRQLDSIYKGTAFFLEPGVGLYVMGDEIDQCTAEIYGHLPEIMAGKSKHGREEPQLKHTVVMDADILNYMKHFHIEQLASIAVKYDLNITYEILDGFAQFIMNGSTGHEEAETEIGQLADQCQHQLCTHAVPVIKHITNQEVTRMNTEFQHMKAVIEYDRASRCIHIIASKENAHQVKDEIAKRFPPRQSSGSVPSGAIADMPSRSAGLAKPGGGWAFYGPPSTRKPGPKHHSHRNVAHTDHPAHTHLQPE